MNAREFYHFSRLREDETAQWDIRQLAVRMGEAAKKVMPLTFLMLGGKDVYPQVYEKVFLETLKPAVDVFKPEFVFISDGFDAHYNDPLASMKLTTEGFGRLTEIVVDMADSHAKGRIVSTLEGGYNLEALAASVREHVKVLGGFVGWDSLIKPE